MSSLLTLTGPWTDACRGTVQGPKPTSSRQSLLTDSQGDILILVESPTSLHDPVSELQLAQDHPPCLTDLNDHLSQRPRFHTASLCPVPRLWTP